MATTTDLTRPTAITALLLSSLAAGVNLSLSTFLVPRLLESPTPTMLTQWARTYSRGAKTIPTTAAVAAAAYIWLGWKAGPGGGVRVLGLGVRELYYAAAALSVGMAPYTVLVMQGTNDELHRLEKVANAQKKAGVVGVAAAGDEVVVQEKSAKALVDWWGLLNLGRAGMLIGGVVCGLVATF
ncbi:hypothetical protein B0J18DRAFT_9886 [Chaetomium sp. MPI-SDFR-AT-0129]|nr:hypothetical protein B0J18DRAFT_9886 [Chaetomium sp. MPI-SDFR-AT-0129]